MKQPRNISKKLKGKELVDYIEQNKEQLKGNGDELCLAAGYGKTSKEGDISCDLPLFIKEFSQAMGIDD
tara:strand:- start:449 stop:655 length:207 start_codon:yes stop_codon:yes gene_type:complete